MEEVFTAGIVSVVGSMAYVFCLPWLDVALQILVHLLATVLP